MTERNEIYKCEICENTVEVLFEGAGELVCCGEPMKKLEEHAKDIGQEKHVPVFEKMINGDILVKVGETPHPMTEEHHVKMIEIFTDDGILRKYFEVNQKPEFLVKLNQEIKHAREYCNIHGLWKGENHVI